METQVVFINPPTMDNAYGKLKRFAMAVLPIGMAYVSAYLESKRIENDIIDCDAIGFGIEEAVLKVQQVKPKFVGVMAMTATMGIAQQLIRRVRAALPGSIIMLGGVHGTALPERTMRENPDLDVVVMGEGEYTTYELIQAYEKEPSLEKLSQIQGICFRHQGKIIKNEGRPFIQDLDSLPFPNREKLPVDVYQGPGWFRWIHGYTKPYLSVFTSRGCPFNCNFCAAHIMCGRKVRYRSIKNVMAEVDYLHTRYRIKILHFQDDTFTLNRDRAMALCNALIERNYNLHVICCTRVDQVDETLLEHMHKAGVEWIFYGVESGNQDILNQCSKNITLDQIRRAFALTKRAGIGAHAGIILGHIGETRKTAMDSIRFLKEITPDYAGIATLIPFPGSRAWQYCQDNHIHLPRDWNDYGMVNSVPISVNAGLAPEELLKLRDRAIFTYYSDPKRLWRFATNPKYNKKLVSRDHIYNLYALILRKMRLSRRVKESQ